ncbi:nicotinate-nucleotide diphosphorylase (carboxylating) [Endomicrobiia bacterium]|uniref:carboxylating nicotinate-nucleotide diphosphorylase n=1 Tax=Endomicrobium trichonymphae TaxID=1408204 RepID=UPI000864E491|nr:carboxylating nicotinate-nucleotide diphosphorylase [Candidatus Endomicrobium trichonymphae]GHT06964.1 nicotinate-nucleotide diphosphorylase (carboxylating) [Endomicrobiia bacterium]BAV59173.1 nicotinate-nucleotide pyrophosphorylase [Candidatus Endomicrobium trichonymphae]GHT09699.1 nicotinate-nucleotide diphosphorylase (carboxylating) [Endomicrobiia bacterium]GHT13468.1 nicotinate-nucleotide diphosphorylase (carboxylating) [Endomicrobiia bacterium]GHT17593.1 nicotinate-nucleotide diphospho
MVNNTDSLIDLALKEDGVFDDITTKEFIPKDKRAKAVLIANSPGILCGVDIFIKVFKAIDKKCKVSLKMKDCSQIKSGDKILEITGHTYTILSGERTALNFLQYMSGIATLTNRFVTSINNGRTKIYDTRKTIPGYRELAKYAVRCGGGANHRMGLYDMVLIKDNHLKLMKDLTAGISEFRKKHKNIPVEVECENLKQVEQALDSKADIIMLDNTTFENTKKMISLIRKNSTKEYNPEIEISGGVSLKTAKKFARLDADRISIGMITHSSSALDVTLEITIK